MIDWPVALINDLARRRSVLFLGSGVSKNSAGIGGARPPLWSEFLERALSEASRPKKHIQTLLGKRDYLTACELLKEKLDEEWVRIIREAFVRPQYQPVEIHNEIFKLDSRLVLTQNFDKIYDTHALSVSTNTVVLKNYYDSDVVNELRGDSRAVVKVHGTIDSPDKMIFTRRDYRTARYAYASFFACLDALAVTHTFIFIGCGFEDPNVQLMLERYAGNYPSGRPHYIVAPKGIHKDIKASYRDNLSLRILDYDPSDHHAALTTSLKDLREKVEVRRSEIAGAQDW